MKKQGFLISLFLVLTWTCMASCACALDSRNRFWQVGPDLMDFQRLDNGKPKVVASGRQLHTACPLVFSTKGGDLLFHGDGDALFYKTESESLFAVDDKLPQARMLPQSATIVAAPGAADTYTLAFLSGAANTLHTRSLTPETTPRYGEDLPVAGSVAASALCVIGMPDGKGFWLVTKCSTGPDLFAVFQLTENGMEKVDVSVPLRGEAKEMGSYSSLAFNTRGTALAFVFKNPKDARGYAAVSDFDAETGTIADPRLFPLGDSVLTRDMGGCAFSPDGRFLYTGNRNLGGVQLELATGVVRSLSGGILPDMEFFAFAHARNEAVYATIQGDNNNEMYRITDADKVYAADGSGCRAELVETGKGNTTSYPVGLPVLDVRSLHRARADLAVTLTASPMRLALGDTCTFTTTITNLGPEPETNLTARPPYLEHFSLISHTVDGGVWDAVDNIWKLPVMEVNDTVSITMKARAVKVGNPTLSTLVMPPDDGIDPDRSNNHKTVTLDVVASLGSRPSVIGTNIKDGASGVGQNITLEAQFSESMDPASFTVETVTLTRDTKAVAATLSYNNTSRKLTLVPRALLSADTPYVFTIQKGVLAKTGATMMQDLVVKFRTEADLVDSDQDGVPDLHDRFPDDNRRATVTTSNGAGVYEVDGSGFPEGASLEAVTTLSDQGASLPQKGKPEHLIFRDGLLAYRIANLKNGAAATVSLQIPSGVPDGARIYKIDAKTGYTDITDQCTITGNRISLKLTDGGFGDADGVQDGRIEDPIGVASPVGNASGSASGGSGGCFIQSCM